MHRAFVCLLLSAAALLASPAVAAATPTVAAAPQLGNAPGKARLVAGVLARSVVVGPELPMPPIQSMSDEKKDELRKTILYAVGVGAAFGIGLPVFFDGLSLLIFGAGGAGWFTPGVAALYRGSPDGRTLAAGIVGVILGAAFITVGAILLKPALKQFRTFQQTSRAPRILVAAPGEPGLVTIRF